VEEDKMRTQISVLVIVLCCFSQICHAKNQLVPSQYPTIQAAVNAAASGDTIIISPGQYAGTGNTYITISGKFVKIRSINPSDPNIVAGTVLECYGAPANNSEFYLNPGCSVVLDGLTIRDGYSNTGGGAIYSNGSMAIIRNCVFRDCTAPNYDGGAIYAINTFLNITNCAFYDSIAGYGGAIYLSQSEVELDDCVIDGGLSTYSSSAILALSSSITLNNCQVSNNLGESGGPAVYVTDSNLTVNKCNFFANVIIGRGSGVISTLTSNGATKISIKDSNFTGNRGGAIYGQNITIERCSITANIGTGINLLGSGSVISSLIAGNWSASVAGISCSGGRSRNAFAIQNCTIADNLSSDTERNTGSGLYSADSSGDLVLLNSIFWNNSLWGYTNSVSFCNIPSSSGLQALGSTNMIIPQFVKPGVWQNNVFMGGDYHLGPQSPCVNAGDPNYVAAPGETDLDGNPRIRFGRIDMGAYEASSHPMDFNQDGKVDLKDFASFAQAWLWQAAWYGRN
jgi:predicted outer membrane repeat protein